MTTSASSTTKFKSAAIESTAAVSVFACFLTPLSALRGFVGNVLFGSVAPGRAPPLLSSARLLRDHEISEFAS